MSFDLQENEVPEVTEVIETENGMVAVALSWEQEERGLVVVGIEPLLKKKKKVGEVVTVNVKLLLLLIPHTKSVWFRVSSTVDCGVWHHNLMFPLQAGAVAQG